jgi:hypothetical protein
MAAHADDLRYFYAEHLGDSVQVTTPSGGAVALPEPLTPGRYEIRVPAYGGGDLWVRQGPFGDVLADDETPSTQFVVHTDSAHLNYPIFTLMVRGSGNGDDGLSFYGDGGTVLVQVTKVSRDKR